MAKYQLTFAAYGGIRLADSITDEYLTAQSDEDALQQTRRMVKSRQEISGSRKIQVISLVRYIDLPADLPIYKES